MELRCVCGCIAVVGLALFLYCVNGQRAPRDRPCALRRGRGERVVPRARTCEGNARIAHRACRRDILAVVGRAARSRLHKILLACDDIIQHRAELRRVCVGRTVVGLALCRDSAERQRTPRDRADARERGLVQHIVRRARARERQPVKGHALVHSSVFARRIRARGGGKCEMVTFRADKAREIIVRPLRERLRDVCIAIVRLVKSCAARQCEIQLLRRDTARALRGTRRERVVPRARTSECDACIVHRICRPDILAVVRRARGSRRDKALLAAHDIIQRRMELRYVCGSRAVVGLTLCRNCTNRQCARLDDRAADKVIAELVTVGIVCADILPRMDEGDVWIRCRKDIAVIDFRKALRALHQCREEGHRMSLVDAPRRTLAALGGDEGGAVRVLPVRVCRRQLHIRLGSDLDIRRHVSPTDG